MFDFIKLQKYEIRGIWKNFFCLVSEKLRSEMEKILHYIHAKFCYFRACETNFTRDY